MSEQLTTAIYRNRYTGRTIEAVQLTAGNERDVFEWAPGKQFIGPGPDYAPDGLTIFTDAGRVHAKAGHWVYCDTVTGGFNVVDDQVFQLDGWEPAEDAR